MISRAFFAFATVAALFSSVAQAELTTGHYTVRNIASSEGGYVNFDGQGEFLALVGEQSPTTELYIEVTAPNMAKVWSSEEKESGVEDFSSTVPLSWTFEPSKSRTYYFNPVDGPDNTYRIIKLGPLDPTKGLGWTAIPQQGIIHLTQQHPKFVTQEWEVTPIPATQD